MLNRGNDNRNHQPNVLKRLSPLEAFCCLYIESTWTEVAKAVLALTRPDVQEKGTGNAKGATRFLLALIYLAV